jgi:hypothetical protein
MIWPFKREPLPSFQPLTTTDRRRLLAQALNGASLYEKETLARQAVASLGTLHGQRLVRELDRENWGELKP